MDLWIANDLVLENNGISLTSLRNEHVPALWQQSQDRRIWEHYIYDCSNEKRFHSLYEQAFQAMEAGGEHCFVIQQDGYIIGSTRFLGIDQTHRKLEIGWTWMHPGSWGTGINQVCKWLLLNYCFEVLGTVRVQLKTDELNQRSRKAILKIGAKFEGILRNDLIRDDGSHRHSAYYSITAAEWPEVKNRLQSAI